MRHRAPSSTRRYFYRVQIADSVEDAIDRAGDGRMVLHTRAGGEIVGAVELDGERALSALAAYAGDLEQSAAALEAVAERLSVAK